jgi:hypothetical protein
MRVSELVSGLRNVALSSAASPQFRLSRVYFVSGQLVYSRVRKPEIRPYYLSKRSYVSILFGRPHFLNYRTRLAPLTVLRASRRLMSGLNQRQSSQYQAIRGLLYEALHEDGNHVSVINTSRSSSTINFLRLMTGFFIDVHVVRSIVRQPTTLRCRVLCSTGKLGVERSLMNRGPMDWPRYGTVTCQIRSSGA